MTDTNKLFQLAQLAEASYADFWDEESNSVFQNQDKIKKVLIASGFSKDINDSTESTSAQASEFVNNWQVITQQPDTASSFSGALFKYIGNDENSGFQNGQYVYALKGTLELGDGGADIGGIVTDGLAFEQIVDMYNDWHRIRAGIGNTYQAAKVVTLPAETIERQTLLLLQASAILTAA